MLLAVERGGFFSSSASGYSKGLTLLLLGQKNEKEPMRVTPWSQYQLVDQDTDPYPDLQLAPGKKRLVRGCASFVCFGRAASGHDNSSPLKVGPTQNREVLPEPVDIDESKDQVHSVDPVDCDQNIRTIVSLKSSLKKSANIAPFARAVDCGNLNKYEVDRGVAGQLEKRKVHWTDTTGGELFEIREFEIRESHACGWSWEENKLLEVAQAAVDHIYRRRSWEENKLLCGWSWEEQIVGGGSGGGGSHLQKKKT